MSRFKEFSTDDLLAEIVRRRNARVSRRPIIKCEECEHFKTSGDKLSASEEDAYNPCAKGHTMSFRMCEADDGHPDANDDWGFYRKCCPDRMNAAVSLYIQKKGLQCLI